jgi:NDP-sugar pyrophosphorylase family protein
MEIIKHFISDFPSWFYPYADKSPWAVTENLEDIINPSLNQLNNEYQFQGNIAIHKTAVIEKGAVLKGTMIISENCFIGAHAYLRGPIYLGNSVKIGPGCEIKQSIILNESSTAHFNYIGNSIIGHQVNLEAGAICANHYNERVHKQIYVIFRGQIINTQIFKFGSLIGDGAKIGANAVLSPGTFLEKEQIVKRLELIDQLNKC